MKKQPIATANRHLPTAVAWSSRRQTVVSLMLVLALTIVVLGPVTNPIATEELTAPIGRFMAPAHQGLFLGHGYRFFAPDPGPSHLLVYKIHYPDGSVVDGRFPDVNKNWPRLLYHRWFMLSETIFEEHSVQPDQKSFDRMQADLTAQIDRFQLGGKIQMSNALILARERQRKAYERGATRIRNLVSAVGNTLLQGTGGTKIELFCQEREIPMPAEVTLGRKLNDPAGLSQPVKIGEVSSGETIQPQGRE